VVPGLRRRIGRERDPHCYCVPKRIIVSCYLSLRFVLLIWNGFWLELTLHCEARLPLELGRVAAELVVRAEDDRDVGCVEVYMCQQQDKLTEKMPIVVSGTYSCAFRQASIEV
jgi:hypothetical protein